ncbi:MAG: MBL fold metallo-hydrolase, partial [Alphaproteobacteria bacterium]|nr:MBL fold metallo-hydrolase [Alphaproteobacteria bacterium]
KPLHLGDISVTRAIEAEGPSFFPSFLLPDSTEDALAGEAEWLVPRHLDPASGRFVMSLHSYVIRTPRHTILVDTCVGSDKERPSTKPWHHLQSPLLGRLAAAGVAPEEVDFVLCTHLHVDHVGWNTRLVDGRWVPTFPNARYLFHETEYAYWESAEAGADRSGGQDGCFADSVLPVMEAGQALLVRDGHAIEDGLTITPSPGHVCLDVRAGGKRAVFSGDLMHHPVQCAYPEWNSRFCFDAAQSRATRQRFVAEHADTDTLILAAHFAGRIVGNGERCKFTTP